MPRRYLRNPAVPPPPAETKPAAYDPDQEAWGSEGDAGTPPPAPISGPSGEQPSAPPDSVAQLGAPPDDTVSAAKWAYQLHMRLAHDAMMDAKLRPSERRKEVRVTLAGAAKHMMDALRYDVMRVIQKDKEELERQTRGKANAKASTASAAPKSAKIIPIRSNG